ncbi:MAG: amidohydrolase [Planctomycetes bacterium]|nr:amidohydrolase [Planctomycetota bacterium]
MIIDAHAHIFDRFASCGPRGEAWPIGNGSVRFATGETMRILPDGCDQVRYTVETLIAGMDEAGIDKAVLLQAAMYGFHNHYVYESANRYPERLVPTYTLDPYAARADAILRAIETMGGRIFKFEISTGAGLTGIHPYFTVDSDVMDPVYQYARRKNGVVVFDLGSPGMISYQVEKMKTVISRYPDIRFVICHLLAPDGSRTEQWKQELRSLVSDNVWFDISALPWNIREPYPYPASLHHIHMAKELVGADRLIWGSDVPLLLTAMNYRQMYEFIVQADSLRADEKDRILAGNAVDAYWS